MDYEIDSLEVIKIMQPKIKKLLLQTVPSNREDLEQELNLLIIEKMREIKFNNIPSFSDLINNFELEQIPFHSEISKQHCTENFRNKMALNKRYLLE